MATAAGIKIRPTEAGSGAKSRGLTVVLSKNPPWYSEQREKVERSFICQTDHQLYNDICILMTTEARKLLNDPKVERMHMKDSNLKKMIRSQVLSKVDELNQKPTPELVAALMDLAEIERGTALRCFSDARLVDRAGIKHYMLMSQNYVLFYLPTKNLTKGTKPIIPVVTYYKDKANMCYVDKNTSRLGTYIVPVGCFADKSAFFIQEVLSLPDPDSIKVLRAAVDSRFEFWDLSLEVPTHSTALTPSFSHVQLGELIGPKFGQVDKIVKPMLCLNASPGGGADSKRLWFNMTELRSEVLASTFITADGEQATPGLQFKRELRSRNWLMATIPLELAAEPITLHASTTPGFLNAIEHMTVVGNGELPACHKLILLDLVRTSNFMAPPESYDNMYSYALRHYIQRVSLSSITGLVMPGHIDCQISNPLRNEMVALGIRLLSNDIPRAFAIAEMLCGPLVDAEHYIIWCQTMASNNTLALAAKRRNRLKLDTRMSENWSALHNEAKKYCRAMMGWAEDCEEQWAYRYGPYNEPLMENWATLFDPTSQTPENAIRAHCMWEAMKKRSGWGSGKCKETVAEAGGIGEKDAEGKKTKPGSKKTKDIANMVNKKAEAISDYVKLLMYRLKEDQLLIAKCRKTMGSAEQQQANTGKEFDAKMDHMLKKFLPPLTHQSNGGNLASIAWTKNLNHLLQEPNWIYGEQAKKDAVCMMLAMPNTILAKKNTDRFEEWTRANLQNVGNYLELAKTNTNDILSTALKDSYNNVRSSMASWCKLLTSNKRAQVHWQDDGKPSARVRRQKDREPLVKKARTAPAPLPKRDKAKSRTVYKQPTKKAPKDQYYKAKNRTKVECSDFSDYESEEIWSVTEGSEEEQTHKGQTRKARKRTKAECDDFSDDECRETWADSDSAEEVQPRKAKARKARMITDSECDDFIDVEGCDETWLMSEDKPYGDRRDERSDSDSYRSMSDDDQKLSAGSSYSDDEIMSPRRSKSSRHPAKVSSRSISACMKGDTSGGPQQGDSEPRKRLAKTRHSKRKDKPKQGQIAASAQIATSPRFDSAVLREPEANKIKTLSKPPEGSSSESDVSDNMPDHNVIQL